MFLAGSGFSQLKEDQQVILDQLADELLATADEDVSYEELYETLAHLLANPIDLNTVTPEQLRAGMILNEAELNDFLDYRAKLGPFLSTLELQSIPHWSPATVRRILPFATVYDPTYQLGKSLVSRMVKENNAYLVLRYERTLETKKGYTEAPGSTYQYKGSPDKYYLRFRTSRPNDFSLGITAEKDAGEPLTWSPSTQQFGFDFLSGHLQLIKKGRLDNLILGDFQCQFGQGLQLGSAFGLGKTAEAITGIRRSNLGFLPYTAAGESRHFRGIATTIRLSGQIRIHVFFSYKNRDATLDTNRHQVTSLLSSGFHRTTQEIHSRGQAGDRDAGMILQLRNRKIDAGLIFFQKAFSATIAPRAMPYNQFRFQGTTYFNAGGYFNYTWANVTFFSEVAQTVNNGLSATAGILGNLTSKLEMSWLIRDLGSNYFAEYANAFAESSSPQNERGIYWGVKYSFNRRTSISGYLDMFQFPWLRFRMYKPSEGSEWMLRFSYSPSRAVTIFIQAREETKIRNLSGDTVLYRTSSGVKRNVWVSCDFSSATNLTFKTRVQGSMYELGRSTTRGLAIFQDITFKRPRWSLSLRYSLFDSDDYENRQYLYERDVWLSSSLPAYDGAGVANYILFHYSISRQLDLWFRWSRVRYDNQTALGSGGEEITGNTRNDAKFQVRIRF